MLGGGRGTEVLLHVCVCVYEKGPISWKVISYLPTSVMEVLGHTVVAAVTLLALFHLSINLALESFFPNASSCVHDYLEITYLCITGVLYWWRLRVGVCVCVVVSCACVRVHARASSVCGCTVTGTCRKKTGLYTSFLRIHFPQGL